MNKGIYRGVYHGEGWVIFNERRREYMVRTDNNSTGKYRVPPGQKHVEWAGALRYAKRYRNPTAARRMCAMLNLQELGRPCRVVAAEEARELGRMMCREKVKIQDLRR